MSKYDLERCERCDSFHRLVSVLVKAGDKTIKVCDNTVCPQCALVLGRAMRRIVLEVLDEAADLQQKKIYES